MRRSAHETLLTLVVLALALDLNPLEARSKRMPISAEVVESNPNR